MRLGVLATLGLAIGPGAGCDTVAGNYFANRARDFGEVFCVELGGALGIGVDVRAAGLVELGLGVGLTDRKGRAGWAYGDYHFGPWPARSSEWAHPSAEPLSAEIWMIAAYWRQIGFQSINDGSTATIERPFILPGVLVSHEVVSSPTRPAKSVLRWLRVHAFDIEATAMFPGLYARVGFSPGELLDFLLGWFGVDLARDDREWKRYRLSLPSER